MNNVPHLVDVILKGWNERIEYVQRLKVHEPGCARRRHCECPETLERRAESRRQLSLLTQLMEASYAAPVTGEGGPGGGKPKSKPPGNLLRPDELICQLREIAQRYASGVRVPSNRLHANLEALSRHLADDVDLMRELRYVVRQARVFLGYEAERMTLADSVCGNCGGALSTAVDASADVTCAGSPAEPPCGTVYPRLDWVRLYLDGHRAGKVDTTTAEEWSGRPRATLYRWAAEGRITRHGQRGKGKARWDLAEIPRHVSGKEIPSPPPLPSAFVSCEDEAGR